MSEPAEDVLLRAAPFRFLPPEFHESLRARFRELRFAFGETIVRQGEPADAYYVLVAGRARVVKSTEAGKELTLKSLLPGDEFGEAALTEGGTRTATVRCSTAVEVLRLGREEFRKLVETNPALTEALETSARFKSLHGFLYEFSNFGRLPAPALQKMIEKLRPVTFRKGSMIVKQGDPPGPLYVVQHGHVRAFAQNNGKARNLAFYRDGDFFGELSILDGSPRAASAEAVSDCRLLALDEAATQDLRTNFPQFRALMDERRAQYALDATARVPLDFADEILPPTAAPQASAVPDASAPGEDDEAAAPRKRIRKFPFVAQIDEMDCAAACMAMVCRHYGRKIGLTRIRSLCHTLSDGTSLKGICHAAGELGLAARALKVSARNLDTMTLPAIVHWEGNHWIVVYDVRKEAVLVADPARGRLKLSRAEFLEKWTGYAALFDYTESFERTPEETDSLRWLVPFFSRYRVVWAQILGLSIVVSALQLLFPIFTQTVVDRVIVDGDAHLLYVILGSMAVALVFMLLANMGQQFLLAFVAVRIDASILDFLTRRILALPMGYFFGRRTGDIQRRLDGAQEVRDFVLRHGIGGVLAGAQLLGALSLMALYSVALLGVFLLTVPLYVGLMLVSRRVLKPLLIRLEESRGRYRSYQIDAIKGIEAVKAAAAEGAFRDGMLRQFLSTAEQSFRAMFFFTFYDNAVQTVGMISIALFLWAGATAVMRGSLSVGGFVAFNTLAMMAYGAILRLLSVWEQSLAASVLLHRLSDVLEHEPEQGTDRERLKPVPGLEGHIELRGVGFRYGGPDAPSILEGIDLTFAPGKVVALVGRSGSGKTTLVKLLAGLIEPTEGTIHFDGVEQRTLNYRDIRRHIGLVLQDNHIFDGTILENVAFGDIEPNFERVLRATQLAAAHEFILRLPLGYESKIGESGLALSGGQKQRIAIARALYNDPPVLIFDEATSALDTESERVIQSNMAALMAGRTAIVIAHRLSTIRDADTIVVLEKGVVAEVGTHDELMARRGLYFYLASQQAVV